MGGGGESGRERESSTWKVKKKKKVTCLEISINRGEYLQHLTDDDSPPHCPALVVSSLDHRIVDFEDLRFDDFCVEME